MTQAQVQGQPVRWSEVRERGGGEQTKCQPNAGRETGGEGAVSVQARAGNKFGS